MPFATSVPLLISAAVEPTVEYRSVSVWPVALVIVPGPLRVELSAVSPIVALLKPVAKFTVTDWKLSVPVPASVPLWFSVPPVMAQVRPLPIVTVPVFVKLGAVPLWVSVQFTALASIVPEFVCAALAWLNVSGWSMVSVPWLSSCASMVRAPPVPTSAVMVAPAALVSVLLRGTASVAP